MHLSRRTFSGVAALSLIGAIVVLSGPSARGADVRSAPLARSGRSSPVDEFGVAGRKVRDVVAETRGARRLPSLSPQLVSLADDPTAYEDADGALFYAEVNVRANTSSAPVDEPALPTGAEMGLVPADGSMVAEGVAPATGDPFTLNSRPGSTKTIYIDFDGETVTGTAWNQSRGIATKVAPPFDRDGVPGSFSVTEQQMIRDTWQGVAEDFAPFDVNVTTQRPGVDAFTKLSAGDQTYGVIAVVTNENWLCGAGCSGIAYLDVFDDPDLFYSPAWVFPPSYYSAISIANTVSHEVGHNLSLGHDGQGASPYYGGTSVWGPIMGNPGSQYVQWSKGEYSGATNTEDDIAKIGARTGFASDTSSSIGNAVLVTPGTNVTTPDDVVSSAADVDYYAVDVVGQYLKVVLNRSSVSPNMAPQVSIITSAGSTLFNGFYVSTGNVLFFSNVVPNGRYYVLVRGSAHPTDFSTYGSIGNYNLQIYRTDPPTTPVVSVSPAGDQTISASWTGSANMFGAITYEAQLCDTANVCGGIVSSAATSAVFTSLSRSANVLVKVAAVDALGRRSVTGVSSSSVAVLSKPVAPLVQKLRWDDTARTLSVEWGSGTSYAPVTTNSVTLTLTNRATSEQVVVTSLSEAGGSRVVSLPTWSSVWIDASMMSLTSYGTPWNQSASGPVASVFSGRLDAPQVTASPTTIARPSAPQTPGSSSGIRGAAPQA